MFRNVNMLCLSFLSRVWSQKHCALIINAKEVWIPTLYRHCRSSEVALQFLSFCSIQLLSKKVLPFIVAWTAMGWCHFQLHNQWWNVMFQYHLPNLCPSRHKACSGYQLQSTVCKDPWWIKIVHDIECLLQVFFHRVGKVLQHFDNHKGDVWSCSRHDV